MKRTVATPCRLQTAGRFGATHPLYLQGRRVSKARNQQKQEGGYAELAACFGLLLGLLFDRNMEAICSSETSNYMELQPRRPYSSQTSM
jgi:hypothetical protein